MAVVNSIKRDRSSQTTTFTVTNWNADTDMDADTETLGVVADTLGTLIRELARQGIINADISAPA